MCIIIVKQKNNVIPMEILKNSGRINPHGLGIVWLDTYKVSYHESKEYGLLSTTRPFIAHFRHATIGKVGRDNTHPFVCGYNSDELLMMNGTIKGIGNEAMCDSKVLANALGRVPRHTWKQELSKYDCRFVSINTRTRSFQLYNKNLYTYRDGVWYSKDNVLQENLVAVYGTLKHGYSNYQRHLRSSTRIAIGKTANKYPLVINGLPYLIEEKGRGYNVEVDVFKVSNSTLKDLDALEGHPNFYERKLTDVVANGKRYTCWVYFNRTQKIGNQKLYSTYTQPKLNDWIYEEEEEIITSQRYTHYDDDFQTIDESPVCIDCYHDLQHDGFTNYHCTGCGGWFKESEVAYYNEDYSFKEIKFNF